jgi:hypothetical protein
MSILTWNRLKYTYIHISSFFDIFDLNLNRWSCWLRWPRAPRGQEIRLRRRHEQQLPRGHGQPSRRRPDRQRQLEDVVGTTAGESMSNTFCRSLFVNHCVSITVCRSLSVDHFLSITFCRSLPVGTISHYRSLHTCLIHWWDSNPGRLFLRRVRWPLRHAAKAMS